ncbi:MAG: two-component regulator propeller domain-containing protein, partial [bacterium]|nr:two-component regulator propeller domain-containing protein [bacterium]
FVDSKLKKSYTFANTSGGLRSDTIYTLFTDREGVLWIGTNRGVSRFDRLGASQETLSDSANANFIRTLFRAADGTIYAGSNRGLFRKVNDKWEADASQGNRAIFALSEERSGKLLVGSVERSSLDQKASTEAATWAFADFKGEKYAAVNGVGLVQLCPGGNIVRAQERSISSLSAVGEKLYFGTIDKGLFSFDGQALKNEVGPDRLQSGTIWKINSEVDGALLIAGQHGVFRICDQHVEKIIAAEEVRDVFIDGTHIWAATTTRGLLQARHDERFGLLVSEVGFEQGLPSEKAFSILATEDGILVATNRGVVTYRRGSVPPKIIATRIASQRSHDLREAASTIALEYPQNSLLVEVAGQSSRTFPEEFQYAFVLANAKGEEIDRRLSNDFQYSPSGLAAGEYTIEAIAFNRDLLASEALAIRFSVAKAPFPWTATALGVLLVIALLGLVWAFVANRRVLVRNRQLAAAKLDLANEAERERRRIARDLHDQTLADLRSLMLLSDAAKPEIAGFRDEIEAISGEVRRICEDLSPSVLENVGLVAALEFLLKGAIANHSFSAKEHLEENLGFSMNVQLQIYRIAQEVLTNIKSHSSVDSVEMAVDESDGEFVMKIRDDGGAFDPESVTTRGRGIANIRARASMIGADIDWEPNTGSGNRFRLKVSKESRLGLS